MDITDPQNEVFALLSDPATYGGARVRRIDTHAASVFLAGDRAYKVKRAVKFPFLDYSTAEKRKAACEAELTVNRPFAPDIYLRVVAITRDNGILSLDGAGEPVEWAVEMHRFDESATLDHLADRGGIDASLADALARVVAAAHDKAPSVDAEPWLDALGQFIEQNDAAFRASPELFTAAATDALTSRSVAALTRLRPLLLRRGREGLVRRGHGDLHLGNIALIDGKPVPFDAIEFDPQIAAGDVLYDLAFLLMDLAERGLAQAANVVLNRYLVRSGRDSNLDALAAPPLFMSLRAAIRAKVTVARLENARTKEQDALKAAAKAYFDLACDLIAPPSPTLIAVGGLSGTGKSVLARGLASEILPVPGAVLLRSDVERKRLFDMAETEKLPPEAYSTDATERIYGLLGDKARRVLSAGHSVIVDAVFSTEGERTSIEHVAANCDVPFHGLYLTADLAVRVARVSARTADASDADTDIARKQEDYDLGALSWTAVDASGTPSDTLQHARTALRG